MEGTSAKRHRSFVVVFVCWMEMEKAHPQINDFKDKVTELQRLARWALCAVVDLGTNNTSLYQIERTTQHPSQTCQRLLARSDGFHVTPTQTQAQVARARSFRSFLS